MLIGRIRPVFDSATLIKLDNFIFFTKTCNNRKDLCSTEDFNTRPIHEHFFYRNFNAVTSDNMKSKTYAADWLLNHRTLLFSPPSLNSAFFDGQFLLSYLESIVRRCCANSGSLSADARIPFLPPTVPPAGWSAGRSYSGGRKTAAGRN